MAYVNGFIFVGSPWQRARTRGGTIAEQVSRVEPRYAPLPPAGPPYNVSAATAAEEQCIDLAWTNGTPQPAETEVWESADSISFSLLSIAMAEGANPTGLLPLTKTTYKRNAGVFDTLRYYLLRHVNATDFSAFSAMVSARSQKDLPNGPPSGLTVTVRARPAGETSLDIAWTNGDATAATEVFRNGVSLGTVGAGVVTLAQTGLSPNTTYQYQVRHVKSGVNTSFSAPAAATTLVDGPDADPFNPSAVGGTGVAGQGLITVSWANGDASAQTEVHVSSDGGATFALLVTQPAGAISYVHNPGYFVGRWYKFRHTKGGVVSGFTGVVSATSGQDIPDAPPSNLTVTTPGQPTGETQLALAWSNGDVSCATNIYRDGVYRTTVGAGVAAFTDTGLTANTAHTYEVRHTKNGVESTGATATGTTLVDGPDASPTLSSAVFSGVNRADGHTTVTWANGDATCSTELWRNSSYVTTLAPGVTQFVDTAAVLEGVQYTFLTRHTKNGAVSPFSNAVAVTPGHLNVSGWALRRNNLHVIQTASTVPLPTGAFTVEFWARIPPQAGDSSSHDFGVLGTAGNVQVDDGTGTGTTVSAIFGIEFVALSVNGTSATHFQMQPSTGSGRTNTTGFNAVFNNASWPVNTWVHFALTASGSGNGVLLSFYANGILIATRTTGYDGGDGTVALNWVLGINGFGSSFGDYDIDEIRVWTVAKSQTDIQAAMNSTVDPTTANLLAYWQMENTVNGTKAGNPAWTDTNVGIGGVNTGISFITDTGF